MSTPEPTVPPPQPPPPPPNNSAKKWLVGCLVALVLLVLLGLAVLVLGIYVAKKQVDSMSADASKVYDQVKQVAAALEAPSPVAPELVQAAEARMRLSRAALEVSSTGDALELVTCSPDPGRNPAAVDAEWFRQLPAGLPKQAIGTPWFRHPLFASAAEASLRQDASEASDAQAMIALDHGLGEAGTIAVIHTTRLEAGEFDGYMQLIGYPDGETICAGPLKSRGPESELQENFHTAMEAALGP